MPFRVEINYRTSAQNTKRTGTLMRALLMCPCIFPIMSCRYLCRVYLQNRNPFFLELWAKRIEGKGRYKHEEKWLNMKESDSINMYTRTQSRRRSKRERGKCAKERVKEKSKGRSNDNELSIQQLLTTISSRHCCYCCFCLPPTHTVIHLRIVCINSMLIANF